LIKLWSALAGCLFVGIAACDSPYDRDNESAPDTGLPVIPMDGGPGSDAALPSADAALPQADAGRPDFIPKCSPHDGRCSVCVWTDGAAQRCRVSIFHNCPTGSSSPQSCPANPSAACDRAEGYFDSPEPPGGQHADWDFYYAPLAATAQQDCLAQSATLAHERGPRWVTY